MKVGLNKHGLRPIVAEKVRFNWRELCIGALLQSHTVDNNGTYWTVVGFMSQDWTPRRGDRPLEWSDRIELEDEEGRGVEMTVAYITNSAKWVLF